MVFAEPSQPVDQIIARIGRKVGVTSESSALADERIRDALSEAVQMVCNDRPWSFLRSQRKMTTTANIGKYNLREYLLYRNVVNSEWTVHTGSVIYIDLDDNPIYLTKNSSGTVTPLIKSAEGTSPALVASEYWVYDKGIRRLYANFAQGAGITVQVYFPPLLMINGIRRNSDNRTVQRIDEHFYKKHYAWKDSSSSTVQVYGSYGPTTVEFWPTPDSAIDLTLDVTLQHPDIRLGSQLLVPSYLHDCLVYLATRIYNGEASQTQAMLNDPVVAMYMQQAYAIDSPIGHDLVSDDRTSPNSNGSTVLNISTTGADSYSL